MGLGEGGGLPEARPPRRVELIPEPLVAALQVDRARAPRASTHRAADGGDAETGAGMDVGAGLVVSDSSTGLAVDVRVRLLLVHQAEGFSERGRGPVAEL